MVTLLFVISTIFYDTFNMLVFNFVKIELMGNIDKPGVCSSEKDPVNPYNMGFISNWIFLFGDNPFFWFVPISPLKSSMGIEPVFPCVLESDMKKADQGPPPQPKFLAD
mmetsp:Transcript_14301/g.2335  ORF Transcript_14301/g.2335 Transcript_14301/m.2335 type:complete len:109 (-) Transcript_14301:58-384(-)